MANAIAIALVSSTLLVASVTPAAAAEPAPVHVTAPRLDRRTPPPPPRRTAKAKRLTTKGRRSARAFVAAGSAIFGVFYLSSTFVGAHQLDEIHEDGQVTPDERDEARISQLVFLPVVGPLVASPLGQTKGDKAGLVGFGLMQAMGVAYIVGGSVMLARDRRARRLELTAGAAPGGGTLGLRGRF